MFSDTKTLLNKSSIAGDNEPAYSSVQCSAVFMSWNVWILIFRNNDIWPWGEHEWNVSKVAHETDCEALMIDNDEIHNDFFSIH